MSSLPSPLELIVAMLLLSGLLCVPLVAAVWCASRACRVRVPFSGCLAVGAASSLFAFAAFWAIVNAVGFAHQVAGSDSGPASHLRAIITADLALLSLAAVPMILRVREGLAWRRGMAIGLVSLLPVVGLAAVVIGGARVL